MRGRSSLPFATAAALSVGLSVFGARALAQVLPYPYPYYPVPYPSESSLRIEAKPKSAEVYVDAYYVGIVDDFDGTFQRLHLPPGPHDIVLYQEGYHSFRQRLYLSPDRTQKIQTTLEALAPGQPNEARPEPPPQAPPGSQSPLPPGPRSPFPAGGRNPPPPPPAMSATLTLAVQPGDSAIIIDGERWQGPSGDERLLIQVSAGRHHVEIHKDGFDPYGSEIDVRPGETRELNISLTRR